MRLAQGLNFQDLYSELRKTGFKFGGGGPPDERLSLSIGGLISAFLPYLFAGAGLLLLLYFIYGGLSLMLSRGDPKAVQSAKDKITSAVIGFVIVFASYWIVQIIGRILGIEAITNIFQ